MKATPPLNTSDRPVGAAFNFWHSGEFWYCNLASEDGWLVSGAGNTKPEAIEDAWATVRRRRELSKQRRVYWAK